MENTRNYFKPPGHFGHIVLIQCWQGFQKKIIWPHFGHIGHIENHMANMATIWPRGKALKPLLALHVAKMANMATL